MVLDKTNLALKSVESAVYVFYNYTFTQGNKGYGAAIVMILVVFIMIVTLIMQRAEKRFVFYN
jgi:multiple sugar transport system permease protein